MRALRLLPLLLLGACTYPATVVEVVTSTDAPGDRSLTLAVEVQREGGPVTRQILLANAGVAESVPVSFGLTPSSVDRSAPLTVRLVAQFAASGDEPARTVSRVARFDFVSRARTRLPLFLAWRCGNETTGCRDTSSGTCTISQRCEEQGLTCDATGSCVSVRETPIEVPDEDASIGTYFDAVATDARSDGSDRSDAPDVTDMADAFDASDAVDATDATDAVDLVTMDTRVCTPGARRCAGADLYICAPTGTVESYVTTCPTAGLCASGSGSNCGAPACANGDHRCSGQTYEACNADRTGWSTVQTCGGGTSCTTSGCSSQVCTPGSGTCDVCPGVPTDDCLVRCRADGTGYDTIDCGYGQPASCSPEYMGQPAHCI